MDAMRRQCSAWLALIAMMLGIVLPAHAYARHAMSDSPGSELCVDGKVVRAPSGAPASPHAGTCDACCSGFDGGTVPPTRVVAPLPSTAWIVQLAIAVDAGSAPAAGLPLPRGPPLA
jgi:hypothetical protein